MVFWGLHQPTGLSVIEPALFVLPCPAREYVDAMASLLSLPNTPEGAILLPYSAL